MSAGSLLRVIYFDLETNGFRGLSKYSPRHHIIQFACSSADGKHTYASYVKPLTHSILPQSTKIHGISNEQVANAPSFNVVWNTFQQTFLIDNDIQYLLVAHNCYGFDRAILLKEIVAHGICIDEALAKRIFFGDTLHYFHHLAPYELRESIELSSNAYSKYNLAALYEYFLKQPMQNAHDATGDVFAMVEIANAAKIDWEMLFFADYRFPKIGMAFQHDSQWSGIHLKSTDDLRCLKGIADKRLATIQKHLGEHVCTVGDFLACFQPNNVENMERFLRECVNIHDDALLVEIIASLTGKNPLFACIRKEFPFAPSVTGRFGATHMLNDPAFTTVHDLVERAYFDELGNIHYNKRTLGYYKFVI